MSATPPIAPAPAPVERSGFGRWHKRLLGFCLALFAFELGLFLVIFPWLGNWDLNWIPVHSPRFFDIWMSRYFRGALSGLGIVDIYVAIAEFTKQVKWILDSSPKR